MKEKTLFFAIGIYFLTNSSWGQTNFSEDQMQMILDKGIQKYNVRGVSAAIIFPDNKIWTGVSGISHDTVTVKPDMLFAIGSITKNVVAALTLKLAEEYILSLEDPVSKWLPNYPHVDGMITIRQLLNHTSGIYMFWDNQKIWDELNREKTKIWSPEEVLSYIEEPYFPPGEGWHYSNTNYLLLAMIIEQATDSQLSIEFENRFWRPLGIENAFLSLEQDIPDNLAHVYGDDFVYGDSDADVTFVPRASHESITYGSSGLFTTAKDLVHWCHALFEGKVLHEQSMIEMMKFIEFEPNSNMRAYGLGVQQYTKSFSSGKEAIGHGGANIGTSTYMVYLPEYHISIVVMINAFPNKGIDVITKGLIRIILKDLDAISLIPYFNFFPTGFFVICICLSLILISISISRKRKKLS